MMFAPGIYRTEDEMRHTVIYDAHSSMIINDKDVFGFVGEQPFEAIYHDGFCVSGGPIYDSNIF